MAERKASKSTPSKSNEAAAIRQLGARMGVMPSYISGGGDRVRASVESIRAVLQTMGVDVADPARALKDHIARAASRLMPRTIVAWNGRARVELNTTLGNGAKIRCILTRESGAVTEWSARAADLDRRARRGGVEVALLSLPPKLEMGYHRLRVEWGKASAEALVIAAPKRSWIDDRAAADHAWGVFSPLYSLRSKRGWGCGDLTDLARLARWTSGFGGKVVGTLPLMAVYLDEPFDPSPYAPVSRLFWNESYIDPEGTPEWASNSEAHAKKDSPAFQREMASLDNAELVQYRRQATLRRSVLEPLAAAFFAAGGDKSEAFRAFLRDNPLTERYARFRACVEKHGAKFDTWSEDARAGNIAAQDVDAATVRYHVYCQFAFTRQLTGITDRMRESGGIVYLDLPVGVRGDGFDVWNNPGLFARAAMVGAPPDPYFTSGQKWGFPPMHPQAMEDSGFAYLIDSIRHFTRWSDVLRLDHVMAFHRLFWIPRGMEAKDGAYVAYPEEPMWAILCLESHRNQCRLVGENLGTVPVTVTRAMERHGIGSLYVAQYEAQPKAAAAMRPVPQTVVASCNTHDMPPIANWLDGQDVDDRISLGMFSSELRDKEHKGRDKTRAALESFLRKKGHLHNGAATTGPGAVGALRHAIHTYLAASDAEVVLLNIEDLWLEKHWQNMPGTSDTYPNWRHRLKMTLEQIEDDKDIARQLDDIERARAKKRAGRPAGTTPRATRARK